jgi:hypothetical protein
VEGDMKATALIPAEVIERHILFLRGQKVMLDRDLARLYGVPTKILNQAVKRNKDRFPQDFMFQLTKAELSSWLNHVSSDHSRSQFVTLNRGQNIKYNPYAFTEHGILMLSSVLKSKQAIQANIAIMRTFVRLRRMLASNEKLARRIKEMEKKYDEQFRVVFEAIRQILVPPEKPKRTFGFTGEPRVSYTVRNKRH